MIEPTPAAGIAALIVSAAPLLTMAAGMALHRGTGHRLLGTVIIAGALLSLLGIPSVYCLAVSQDKLLITACELAGQAGWFVVGICAVLLAAQRTVPAEPLDAGQAGFR